MDYWTGKYKTYFWFETVSGHEITLGTLVNKLPELFLDKHLAIAYFDSGPLNPSEKEIENGWTSKNEIAYSSKLTLKDLQFPICDNYDQWYLFEERTEIIEVDDFVNYDNFSLQEELDHWPGLKEKFWEHIEALKPSIFVMDGVRVIFVAENNKDIDKIESLYTTKAKCNKANML